MRIKTPSQVSAEVRVKVNVVIAHLKRAMITSRWQRTFLWITIALLPFFTALNPSHYLLSSPQLLSSLEISHSSADSPTLWPTLAASPLPLLTEMSTAIAQRSNYRNSQKREETLAVIGDTRATRSSLGPSSRWPSLVWSILRDEPSALLHLGDWVKDGKSQHEWNAVLKSLTLLKGLQLLNVKGNHDRGGHFEALSFSSPPHPLIRISRVGPILLFLLNSEATDEDAKTAVDSLLADLESLSSEWSLRAQKAQGILFRVWAQHRPLWSGGNHGTDQRQWKRWLVPALERLNIDLMLAGHDHDYERFCPSLGIDKERRCDRHGITYIVSGGGASVTVPLPDLAWRERPQQRHQNQSQRVHFSDSPHHLTIKVLNDHLVIQAWGTTHYGQRELFDEHNIPARD